MTTSIRIVLGAISEREKDEIISILRPVLTELYRSDRVSWYAVHEDKGSTHPLNDGVPWSELFDSDRDDDAIMEEIDGTA